MSDPSTRTRDTTNLSSRIDALLGAVRESSTIDPLCATQVAIGRSGELVAFETFGRAPFETHCGPGREADADNHTLFAIYSVTKAIVSAAVWLTLQDGKLTLKDRVIDAIPEFGRNGKEAVTVEQLLTHTSGFPSHSLALDAWRDRARRVSGFGAWQLEWTPGTRFVYHGNSSMMVLAELMTRSTGSDYRDFIRERICEPLGLENLFVGLPDAENSRVADVIAVGEPIASDERATLPVDAPVVADGMLDVANDPESRAAAFPGGGGIATAADVAMFYQGILADAEGRGAGIWTPETLRNAWTIRNEKFLDPMTEQPALRGLGVVMAGESPRIWRGFAERCSPRAFGHMGAGGQVSWADPESGLSFAFVTNGALQDPVRQGTNGVRLSGLAARCIGAHTDQQ